MKLCYALQGRNKLFNQGVIINPIWYRGGVKLPPKIFNFDNVSYECAIMLVDISKFKSK